VEHLNAQGNDLEMSSTLRGTERNKSDYYVTPQDMVDLFFKEFCLSDWFYDKKPVILEPCAGGQIKAGEVLYDMPYVNACKATFGDDVEIDTLDIREDSLADIKQDCLCFTPVKQYDLIITNPPFDQALEICEKYIPYVLSYGSMFIILQRLNFLGSKSRKAFFDKYPPDYIYVHSKRPRFTNTSGTDSIEYAHFVWGAETHLTNENKGHSLLRVI